MVTFEEALGIILREAPSLPTERALLLNAGGRVLAEPAFADEDMPAFNRSAMDGYAVVASDTSDGVAELRVVEEVYAGDVPTKPVRSGQASKIMTGAPVPEGADCVVMVERTEPAEPGIVRVLECARPGQNIDEIGRFARRGKKVIEPGRRLRPVDLGLLAFVGMDRPEVYRQPRCAIISTGDELVDPSEKPMPGQIRNSNAFCLASQLAAAGAQVDVLGIGRDEPETLAELIRRGLEADVFVSTAGVSVGERDLVRQILANEGVQIFFDKVAVKPGKPTVLGRRNGTLVFGLPGNPLSAMVTCELFTLPAIRKMTGQPGPLPRSFKVRRGPGKVKPANRRQFLPARLGFAGGEWQAELLRSGGSGDLISMTYGDGLAILPENEEPPPIGGPIDFLPFTGFVPPSADHEGGRERDESPLATMSERTSGSPCEALPTV